MERSYTVVGMTCDHCVAAVREEVGQITGVTGVEVDLRTGRLDVESAAAIPVDQVREAVEEAGYELKETS